MSVDTLAGWAVSTLLLSLRIAPVFALAPPFTLTRVPPLFRALFGVALAGTLVSSHPGAAPAVGAEAADLFVAAVRELFLGAIVVMAFQLMFGALYFAGRTLDIQAGFGLALLADPTSRNQTPLAGTLFALVAAAVFFSMNGAAELLRLLGASLDVIPLGAAAPLPPLGRLTGFISAVFLTGLGVAATSILCLFVTDLTIAMLSRTAPQMNVLVLGFQVKTFVLFLTLPASFGAAGALFARLARITLEAIPGLL